MEELFENEGGGKALRNKNKKAICFIIFSFAVSFFLGVFLLGVGEMDIGFKKALSIVIGKGFGIKGLLDGIRQNEIAVVWAIRLPRVVSSFFVGAGLGVCGAIFQSILINPLADPYTIGISSGSAFGASLAIILNIFWDFVFSPTIFAFVFAFLSLILVIMIAEKSGDISSPSIVIAGIIISSIFSSAISFLKMLAGESVGAIVFFLMGSFSSVSLKDAMLVFPAVTILFFLSLVFARDLNLMTLGDKAASSLGVSCKKVRLFYLIIGSLLTAFCVSVSGIIGFVGLVCPHILRKRFTSDNRLLIPLCFVVSGLVLLVSDSVTRNIFGGEIPVGVLTTLIGGPFFIYVYLSKGGKKNG